jgi:uncharacterized membrane protein
VDVIWLTVSVVQFPVCLYLGYRVAMKTGRSLLNWVFVGFLASIVPIVGVVLMVVSALWYPTRSTAPPLHGANPDEPHSPLRPRRR